MQSEKIIIQIKWALLKETTIYHFIDNIDKIPQVFTHYIERFADKKVTWIIWDLKMPCLFQITVSPIHKKQKQKKKTKEKKQKKQLKVQIRAFPSIWSLASG